jgi:hypothetical protein
MRGYSRIGERVVSRIRGKLPGKNFKAPTSALVQKQQEVSAVGAMELSAPQLQRIATVF